MSSSIEKSVPRVLADTRVDRAVATMFSLPTATVRRLCEQGRVRVDGAKQSKGDRVKAGSLVEVVGPDWFVVGAAAPLVLHLGPDLVVVDKPSGVPCHPLVPGEGNTVADAVVGLFPEVRNAAREEREAGLLHRLDTGTSGCLAFARSGAVWDQLRANFDAVDKTYLAIVQGACGAGVVDEALAHDPADPRRMRVDGSGRPASTVVTPLSTTSAASLVRLELHGGRRHQLRVHLAHLGHPLVGDPLYSPGAGGFFLHAWRLGLAGIVVEAPVPPRFAEELRTWGLAAPSNSSPAA